MKKANANPQGKQKIINQSTVELLSVLLPTVPTYIRVNQTIIKRNKIKTSMPRVSGG